MAAATNGEAARLANEPLLPDGFRVLDQPDSSPFRGFTHGLQRVIGLGDGGPQETPPKPWAVALSGTWAEPGAEHINALEIRTAGYGVGWALRNICSFDGRFVLLTDSSVALGVLTKGRTSSFPLLRCVRRVNALLLATGVRPLVRYVESEANPADLPSRRVMASGDVFRWRRATDLNGAGGFAVDATAPVSTGVGARYRSL